MQGCHVEAYVTDDPFESFDDILVGVSVAVFFTRLDYGKGWIHGSEKEGAGGVVAAVVRDLEDSAGEVVSFPKQLRLDLLLDVSRKQEAHIAVFQPEHHAAIIRAAFRGRAGSESRIQDLES